MEVYAAYSKNENLLMKSSSGALFGVIAKLFLKNGDLVFGAAFDDNFNLKHIGISDEQELYKLLAGQWARFDLSASCLFSFILLFGDGYIQTNITGIRIGDWCILKRH